MAVQAERMACKKLVGNNIVQNMADNPLWSDYGVCVCVCVRCSGNKMKESKRCCRNLSLGGFQLNK